MVDAEKCNWGGGGKRLNGAGIAKTSEVHTFVSMIPSAKDGMLINSNPLLSKAECNQT
jgi:hypothetical protein